MFVNDFFSRVSESTDNKTSKRALSENHSYIVAIIFLSPIFVSVTTNNIFKTFNTKADFYNDKNLSKNMFVFWQRWPKYVYRLAFISGNICKFKKSAQFQTEFYNYTNRTDWPTYRQCGRVVNIQSASESVQRRRASRARDALKIKNNIKILLFSYIVVVARYAS